VQYCNTVTFYLSPSAGQEMEITLCRPMIVVCAVLYTEIPKCLRRLYWA
jgi:hypothetical protein